MISHCLILFCFFSPTIKAELQERCDLDAKCSWEKNRRKLVTKWMDKLQSKQIFDYVAYDWDQPFASLKHGGFDIEKANYRTLQTWVKRLRTDEDPCKATLNASELKVWLKQCKRSRDFRASLVNDVMYYIFASVERGKKKIKK